MPCQPRLIAHPPPAARASRTGEPDWRTQFHEREKPRWAKHVEWAKADLLQPGSYKGLLDGRDAVVHSMGILLEANYKGFVSGKEGAFGVVRRLLKKQAEVGANEKPGVTYNEINKGSAETNVSKVPTFVYLSAAASAPFLPFGYLNSKREAEDLIAAEFPALRSVFMRPTFIYDSTRAVSLPIAAGGYLGHEADLLAKGRLRAWLGAMAMKPVKVDIVGEAVVEAIADEQVRGAVEPEALEVLGVRGWRKSML
ncbi:hypothetical protein KEM52_002029 [Ascosphaera acerosa]|nr:hypothetical protein KEM52_002029 [Ascosphaera acerosa]